MNEEAAGIPSCRWIAGKVADIAARAGFVVVMDADHVLPMDVDWLPVKDWWSLRRAYELHGRRSGASVVVARGAMASDPLPFDIEEAGTVVSVRLPGPTAVRDVLAALAPTDLDGAIAAVEGSDDPRRRLVEHLSALRLPAGGPPLADQIRILARLSARAPRGLRLAEPWLTDLPADVRDTGRLQEQWVAALCGEDARWSDAFEAARDEVPALVATGHIQPVVVDDAPTWAGPGASAPSTGDRAASLLDRSPPPASTRDEWHAVARWWAEVRRLTALAADPVLTEQAWHVWEGIDAAFTQWLRDSYGALLSSAAPWPSAVHRVPDLLWRRMESGAPRVVVLVLDGLGMSQWLHVRERASLELAEDGTTMALVPTWTSVSRQAIAAGELPTSFRRLWETADERSSWQRYWVGRGLQPHETMHRVVHGRGQADRIDLGAARAAMIVAAAPDELMHTAELLGDAQVLAGLDAWVGTGWLTDFIADAHNRDYEVWITADHGNVECRSAGEPRVGLAADAAGKRLLRFRTAADRAASGTHGTDWDDIPGLPSDAPALRFAPGRAAYTNLPISVSHGGLSLDEVIVPLARLAS